MKTHTGERNFKCLVEDCDKYFSEKGNMMKHYLRHIKKIDEYKRDCNTECVNKGH